MPVYKLAAEMPYDEYVAWMLYFEKRPYGWREDLRSYYQMKTFGLDKKPHEIFPSLEFISKVSEDIPIGEALKGSYLHHMIAGAKDGIALPED
ncbi:MAG: hypothetical protein DRQ62_00030 [Gammaproteobacteria bacterium]|nr:MAG: hypothetical protein DRQ62_00030 [Gammaproteobacteria bacterium]